MYAVQSFPYSKYSYKEEAERKLRPAQAPLLLLLVFVALAVVLPDVGEVSA